MNKIISLVVFSLFFTSACSNDAISKAIENESVIPNKSSTKNLNVSERKAVIAANIPLTKDKLSVKNLPQNFIFVPLTRQATDYTCGVGVLQSILMHYGDEFREDELAKELKSDPNDGTLYSNIAKFSKSKGYKVQIFKNMTLDDLKKQINNKKPVIVLLQAWKETNADYATDWDDGHYSIAIGYDEKRIYFMDPSTLGYYTYIPTEQFLDRWHDVDAVEKLHHFGMIIEKASPKYNHNDVLKMD